MVTEDILGAGVTLHLLLLFRVIYHYHIASRSVDMVYFLLIWFLSQWILAVMQYLSKNIVRVVIVHHVHVHRIFMNSFIGKSFILVLDNFKAQAISSQREEL